MPGAYLYCPAYDGRDDEQAVGCRFRDTTNDQTLYGNVRITLPRATTWENFASIRRRNRERFVCTTHGRFAEIWNRWDSWYTRQRSRWNQHWQYGFVNGTYRIVRRRPAITTTHTEWLT